MSPELDDEVAKVELPESAASEPRLHAMAEIDSHSTRPRNGKIRKIEPDPSSRKVLPEVDLGEYAAMHQVIKHAAHGGNLWKIAKHELRVRGENANDSDAMWSEINRIAALNGGVGPPRYSIQADKPVILYDQKAIEQLQATGHLGGNDQNVAQKHVPQDLPPLKDGAPETLPLTIAATPADGVSHTFGSKEITHYQNDDYKVELKDGSGRGLSHHVDGDHAFTDHYWGKSSEQNKDFVQTSDGERILFGGPTSFRKDFADGRGFEHHSDGKGGFEELHWNSTGKTYIVKESGPIGEGKREFLDGSGNKISETASIDNHWYGDAVLEQRERLHAAANKLPSDEQRAALDVYSNAFEARALKQGLTSDQVAQTYQYLTKLLTSDGVVPVENRATLALHFMNQLAQPDQTSKGSYDTGKVTTSAELAEIKHPDQAAGMITEAALHGRWTAPDGKQIVLEKGSLIPTPEAKATSPAEGERSYATQLLNIVMNNEITQRRNPPEIYTQEASAANANRHGEHLKGIDGSEVTSSQRAFDPTLEELDQQRQRLFQVQHTVVLSSEREKSSAHVDSKGPVDVQSPSELSHYLSSMKSGNKLPVTVSINKNTAVSVTDYKGGDLDVAQVDSPSGKTSFSWITVRALYDRMHTGKDTSGDEAQNTQKSAIPGLGDVF